jgi:glucose/arabinose dehydrogenase
MRNDGIGAFHRGPGYSRVVASHSMSWLNSHRDAVKASDDPDFIVELMYYNVFVFRVADHELIVWTRRKELPVLFGRNVRHHIFLWLLPWFFPWACSDKKSKTEEPALPYDTTYRHQVVDLVSGLEHPWSFAFLPNGDILVTERAGRLRLIREGELLEKPVSGVPEVYAQGQGGLLDLALPADFSTSSLLYFTYAKAIEGGPATTAVARAKLIDDQLMDLEDIFVANAPGGGVHFGSRLVFAADGTLIISVGERGLQAPAQKLDNHIGKTIRIHPDGQVPTDNPFVGQDGVLPEIYSLGHRNAQGMALQPGTGLIWQSEHGPKGGDELNLIKPAVNYGWPIASFGDHYDGQPIPDHDSVANVELPQAYWVPSIAPSGMAFYNGDQFPAWRGHSFHGALAGKHLVRAVIQNAEVIYQEKLLEDWGQRIRDVRVGPDGYLYLLTDADNAVLARLEPLP